MAKIKLLDHLKALATIELFFGGITTAKDADGKMIAILQLEGPVDTVRSSQEWEVNGVKKALVLNDVTEVKVHESNLDDSFEWDPEAGLGHIKTDKLSLDVSRKGQVWLVPVPFAQSGAQYAAKLRSNSISALFGVKPADEAVAVTKPTVVADGN